jgi:hypothetical protein
VPFEFRAGSLHRVNGGALVSLREGAYHRVIVKGSFHMSTRTYAALLIALSICGCATPHSSNTTDVPGPGGPSPCLGATGSMIPSTSNCTPTGRSYSQADIARTGETTAAGALGALGVGVGVGFNR